MRRYLLWMALVAAVFVSGWLACSGRVGGVPRGVTLVAASDSTVLVSWNEPEAGTPDSYLVYFRRAGSEGYMPLVELTAIEYQHDPKGTTGCYRVAALFGADLYYADETPSTLPVATSGVVLAELNASGNSGFGWDRTTGLGESYTMREAASAARVDFFVTDFQLGYGGPTYALASPTYGPSDPSGEVPVAPWRLTRFSAALPGERAPLPAYDDRGYLPFRDVEAGFTGGCYTDDGHYAMVKVTAVNTFTGELRLDGWFQLVQGLRLIRH